MVEVYTIHLRCSRTHHPMKSMSLIPLKFHPHPLHHHHACQHHLLPPEHQR
ncbi:hypothetical protein HN873_063015, partial [Arachis hypogaea]